MLSQPDPGTPEPGATRGGYEKAHGQDSSSRAPQSPIATGERLINRDTDSQSGLKYGGQAKL